MRRRSPHSFRIALFVRGVKRVFPPVRLGVHPTPAVMSPQHVVGARPIGHKMGESLVILCLIDKLNEDLYPNLKEACRSIGAIWPTDTEVAPVYVRWLRAIDRWSKGVVWASRIDGLGHFR